MYINYKPKGYVLKRHIHKLLLIMRLTTLILITAIMQVSASTFAQKITLHENNSLLEKVFDKIRQQTGYDFITTGAILKNSRPVKIEVRNAELDEVLKTIFATQPLDFKIQGKIVVVSAKQLSFLDNLMARFQEIDVKGKVVNEKGEDLEGATITIKGTTRSVRSNSNGEFFIQNVDEKAVLVISYLGYESREVGAGKDVGTIKLAVATGKLEEVNVSVNTGYQTLPKERATGSFVQIDNELFNRRISTDVLSRLEDISPGLIYNRDVNTGSSKTKLSIRGQSTINANVDPLVILNNFPFEGDIEDINPNDVESISLLKDAAAASIWGARAGNGVIVITTKKGYYNAKTKVSFTSNLTIGDQPDLFYQPQMSSADFIEIEKKLFAQGYYQTAELSNIKPALTPVVDLLIAKRDGLLDGQFADARIEVLKEYDLRNYISKYFYQKSTQQQYALNISGGSEKQKYYISGGFDRNKDNLVRNGFNRSTVNAINTYSLLKQKLEVTTGFNFVQSKILQNNTGHTSSMPYYSYTKLADEQGNQLVVPKNFSTKYLNSIAGNGLMDWTYSPLQELAIADQNTKSTNLRINATVNYKITDHFQANVLYQYDNLNFRNNNLQNQQTYYTRNLINSYTQSSGGILNHPIPQGGILDKSSSIGNGHRLRGQLNFNQKWNDLHEISAIAGYEISSLSTHTDISRLYGYDDEHATSKPVDYVTQYSQYYNLGTTLVIPNRDAQTYLTDRFLSYFSNAAYTYRNRYTLSGSMRLDRSNIFGVNANQKGVPLWSAGIAWNVNQESFYKVDWLTSFKIRATYGYSGNVYKNLSAYTTASYSPNAPNTQLPYASILNPPNPELRWERIKMLNLGIDFNTKNSIISGSIEYFHKNGIDLIGLINTAPQTGIVSFSGNNASTTGNGIDLTINTQNINRQFKWNTAFMLSYISDRVTSYNLKTPAINYVQSLGGLPMLGRPLYAIYSYQGAGINPQNGNPQGYLDGNVSEDYAQIINTTKADQLIYGGTIRPTYFGALRNSFSWKGLSISANISYRLGYYFRRNSINYAGVLTAQGGHGDYAMRWQKPGDEAFTQIPSLPASIDQNRDNIYLYSTALVEKGDHIRLQDVSIGYDLSTKALTKTPFSRINLYLYANNLGVIWTASKTGVDPDYQYMPVPFSIAGGIKLDF